MKRDLIPGAWGRCGRAIPDPQVSELDNAVPPRGFEDYRQGRDSLTQVGPYSILAGKPRPPTDAEARAMFWTAYLAAVALTAFCAVVLALWPN